jgi:cytochrome c553
LKRLAVLFVLATVAGAHAAPASYPDWAYAVPTPQNEAKPPRDDGTVFTLPGSKGRFTRSQISGTGHKPPADWYPGDHPPMPRLIAAGDAARGITACAACHYPNGKGRPQNGGIAGLNADYLARQLHDMKMGRRRSAEPRKHNAQQMVAFAKAMTDAEIHQVAAYFASLPPVSHIKVVETASVGRMRSQEGMWLPAQGREPIGNRIIETPVNVGREQLRDPRGGFIAYVPKGAVARGKSLARILQCAACHGDRLTGNDTIPAIAGRSPSSVGRQLYDFQSGTRRGEMAAMMQPVTARLSGADIVNLAAYTASLPAK